MVSGLNIMDGEKKLADLTFIAKKNGGYITFVENFVYDQNSDIVGFEYRTVFNEVFLEFDAKMKSDGSYGLKAKKHPHEYNLTRRNWFTCTGECISDALSICFDEFSCGATCGIMLAMCPDSIVTACGIWCAKDTDNDLTPNE